MTAARLEHIALKRLTTPAEAWFQSAGVAPRAASQRIHISPQTIKR